ncbi:MAG: response regulator transcription factor [Kouleothrix sp.]|nr:response regulator transcription factor [Kouleothrix sp.]
MSQPTHILVIEDDPSVARGLCAGLEREGYAVTWKANGDEGTSFARDHKPHLIILDVRLPDGSGFDVCRGMRRLGLRQPIMMLTVQRDEVDKILGLEMGADDYLTKPYRLGELRARVRALLRRAYGELSAAQADTFYVGDLIVDRTSGQVTRGSRPVNLSPTEFRLLVYFARHPGQALTRTQLLEAVWGYDADVDDENTVTVSIRRLREKIEADPSHPALILTVPGIGYRLAS